MNWDQVEGKWKQAKGSIKQKWGRLTDDDLEFIAGKRDELIGKIQERYGITKEEAQKQVESWNFSATGTETADQHERPAPDSSEPFLATVKKYAIQAKEEGSLTQPATHDNTANAH